MANYDIEKLKKAANIVKKIGAGIVTIAGIAAISANKNRNSNENYIDDNTFDGNFNRKDDMI